MSTVMERAEVLHEWGIEPVPDTHRHLRTWDVGILWGDLGVGLLVLVTGGFLAGFGLAEALAVIILGSLIGVSLLAAVASAGADHGLPTMVLFRPVLGLKGSWMPSALNVLQLIGWTAVELWAMSFVADLISERVFGFSNRLAWLIVAAVVCTAFAWWGPVGVTRVWMERFAAWIIIGISVIVTILILTSGRMNELFAGTGTPLPFGAALDLVIAMPISWLPLVADYTRFARNRRSAAGGTFFGYLVANIWLYALGYALIATTGELSSPAGIAAGILSLAGGTIAGVLFLVALLAGETDEAFADVYSAAVSMQNIWPNAPQRALIGAVALVGTLLAAWLNMERYEAFLFLIGSVFIPLFGIFIADHFVNRRTRLEVPELYRGGGHYWFAGGFRASFFLAWLAGFVVFQWIVPVGPTWWLELTASVFGRPLLESVPWLGGSIPAFTIAFVLALRPRARAAAGPLSSPAIPE